METCYKMFRKEIIEKITINENRFGIEPEYTVRFLRFLTLEFYEVGISYYGRTYKEGKKIGLKDAGDMQIVKNIIFSSELKYDFFS